MTDHGGNIYAAARRTGIPEARILDFSASINPLGVPQTAARVMTSAIQRLYHYPEPYSETLCAFLGKKLGVDHESIVCGNGSTELIYLIPRAAQPKRVLIPAPTFGEYERACRNSGANEMLPLRLRAEDAFDVSPEAFVDAMSGTPAKVGQSRSGPLSASGMAFLCNPNNPTGRLMEKGDVLRIAEAARESRWYLVVDEAFIDFCPEHSVFREVESNPYLIVLRSMTKFFALSGLRIGYALLHPSLAPVVKSRKEPWTVNSLAQAAAIAVLKDEPYQQASIEAMTHEKSFMEEGFRKIAIQFVPSRANYYLLKAPRAQEMRIALEEKGILVRDCSGFTGLDETYLRVAVRSRKENKILLKEMARTCALLS
jgi:threonine-phosphate decarboxylase